MGGSGEQIENSSTKKAESKVAQSRAKRAVVLILRSKTERKRSFLRLGRTMKAKLWRHGSQCKIAQSRAKRAVVLIFAKQNRKKAKFSEVGT